MEFETDEMNNPYRNDEDICTACGFSVHCGCDCFDENGDWRDEDW